MKVKRRMLVLFVMFYCICLQLASKNVFATEVTGQESNITSGTFGEDNGYEWNYDYDTKVLTVTGEEEQINAFLFDSFHKSTEGILDKADKIIFEDCVFRGSLYGLLEGATSVTTVQFNNCDTASVTSMSRMFANCHKLNNINISELDTSNVTDMSYIFYCCDSLNNIDMSKLNTSKVTDMSYMFYSCDSLTSIDISKLDTSKVTDMSSMFASSLNIKIINMGGIDTSNVTDMSSMFSWCMDLEFLNISGIDTSNVNDMSEMFSWCRELTNLDISGFDTSNVTDMSDMFSFCVLLRNINVGRFNTSNVEDMSNMFWSCKDLSNIDVSGFETSKVKDMSHMFAECSELTNIDISEFDTSNVENMSYMFAECENLTNIDVSGFNTSRVVDMSHMFYFCSKLTNIDVSKFDTSKVKSMSSMFCGCKRLTNIDVSNFDTSKVGFMKSMFSGCEELKNIDVKGFDTSKVTDMQFMFNCCRKLTSIDISGWDTTNVILINKTFSECEKLETIYTPKKLDEEIGLPGIFYDLDLNLTNVISQQYSNTMLKKHIDNELLILAKTSSTLAYIGDAVKLSVTAIGGDGNYTYSFLVHNKDTNKWSRLTSSFTKNDTFTWNAISKGNREFFVEVKDGTGKVVRSRALNVKTVEALKIVAKTSSSLVTVGDTVKLSAIATGGDENYTYSFLVHNKDTNKWARLTSSFTKNNTYLWKASSTGNRVFYIEVKDGTGKVVRSTAITVKTENNFTITASASVASVNSGDEVILTGNVIGGVPGYTYSVIVHNETTNKWARLADNVTSNTYTWKAGSSGERVFYIDVKDSTGKIVRSNAVEVNVR